MSWLTKLGLLFKRATLHREMEEEMAFHLEALVKELEANGMEPAEARREARLRFGGSDSVEERTHAMTTFWWESGIQDIRYAFRMLKKNRILTAVVVISLALGIGANVAIFTVMNALLLRMLPVHEPERLVMVGSQVKDDFPDKYVHDYEGSSRLDEKSNLNTGMSVSKATYELIQKENTVFEQTFAFAANESPINVGLDGRAEPAVLQGVSGNFFTGLGVTTILGRELQPFDDDASATPVAVASYKFWTNHLGADGGAIGKKISINGTPVQLVGVAPAEFFGVDPSLTPDFWVPLSFYKAQWNRPGSQGESLDSNFAWWLTVVGRLKPDVTRAQAAAEVSVLFARSIGASDASPGDPTVPTLLLEDAAKGLNHLRDRFSKSLWLLMAMVGVVLLIASANVAALLLARASARRREVATRMSLGARRGRVVRQLLTESLVLSAIGGAAGLVLSQWITRFLVALLNRQGTVGPTVQIDTRVLLFAFGVSIACGVAFGLAPALSATREGLLPMLKQGGVTSSLSGRRFRFGKLLVTSQVALCVLLLITSGLLIQTLKRLQNVDLGFNKDRIATFMVRPGMNGYQSPAVSSYYQELQRRLEALPGVHSVTYSQYGPIGRGMSSGNTYVPGYNTPEKKTQYFRHIVGGDYFSALQIPVVLGRPLGPQDTSTAKHVVVINEKAVKEIFHGDNPIGRQMVMGTRENPNPCEVVGVVRDVRYAHIRDDVPATVYFPIEQMRFIPDQVSYLVRSAGEPKTVFREISATALALNPNVPVVDVVTEETVVDENLYMERAFAALSGAFAAVGLLLACVGLYGTIAYTVVQRTNEIGVRLALGAARERIVMMVLREALVVVVSGLAIGVPAAWVSTGVLKAQLYGLSPHDAGTIALAMGSIVLVTLAAGFMPARKASKIDPMVALRYE